MLWIGLTGGLGSGKSTVAKILRELGYTVVDADEMSRLAVGPDSAGLTKVLDQFGAELRRPDGTLDRKILAERVFGNASQLEKLESIVHPEVRRLSDERRRAAENRGETIAFYDVPLLFEKNMEKLFSKVVVVDCSPGTQIARAMARDGLTQAQALSRMQHQIPLAEKARRADVVVPNEGSLADLKSNVEELLRTLKTPGEA